MSENTFYGRKAYSPTSSLYDEEKYTAIGVILPHVPPLHFYHYFYHYDNSDMKISISTVVDVMLPHVPWREKYIFNIHIGVKNIFSISTVVDVMLPHVPPLRPVVK